MILSVLLWLQGRPGTPGHEGLKGQKGDSYGTYLKGELPSQYNDISTFPFVHYCETIFANFAKSMEGNWIHVLAGALGPLYTYM